VLGGFVGASEAWADFEREWRKILVKHDLRYIRAKQLFHRQGPYRHWEKKRIRHLWADLLYVLQEQKGLSVSKMVLHNDVYYRSYVSDGPHSRRERLDTKYALCVRCAMHLLPKLYHRQGEGRIVNFILEAGHRNAGDALRVFSDIKKQNSYAWTESVGAMSFGSKEDFPALQASDLISYWFYKTEIQKIADEVENPYEISELEIDLANCGLPIMDHVITPMDLTNLRQNFLAKNKKNVFSNARAVMKGGHIFDVWGTPSENQLFGLEASAGELDLGYVQSQSRFRPRR
jgi:hypothetical protein